MFRRIVFGLLLATLLCTGCFVPNSAQRLVDSAYNLNVATRFGRMDVALENVAPDHRPDFSKAHAGWGEQLRIVDVEFGGMNMLTKDDAVVFIAVSWQTPTSSQLHVTELHQKWERKDGTWLLAKEKRAGGSYGLLGDEIPEEVMVAEPPPPKPTHFPTKVILPE